VYDLLRRFFGPDPHFVHHDFVMRSLVANHVCGHRYFANNEEKWEAYHKLMRTGNYGPYIEQFEMDEEWEMYLLDMDMNKSYLFLHGSTMN
jgi:hypothetical protein